MQMVDGGGRSTGAVTRNEKAQREIPMGTSCRKKAEKEERPFLWETPHPGARSQVVSLRGRHWHPLVVKEETEAAGREVTCPRSQRQKVTTEAIARHGGQRRSHIESCQLAPPLLTTTVQGSH